MAISAPYMLVLRDQGSMSLRRVSWSGRKKKQKRSKEKHDYYALLGLENDRWLATEAQIQKGALAPAFPAP